MSRFRVLVTAPYFQPVVERFRARLEEAGCELVIPEVSERLEEAELLDLMGEIDGVIAGDDRFTARVLDAAPRLKVLSKWGTGIDSFDQQAARRAGVAIRNTPGAFTDPVADQALGYLLAFSRRIPWISEATRRGDWSKQVCASLSERTVGIVGVGRIGSAFARRVAPTGARLLGNDIAEIDPDLTEQTGMESLPLEELLAASDYVSLHCDLNESSRHLINEASLAHARQGQVIINTARGPIIEQAALVAALRDGRLGGAALDVFEHEPLPADDPLRSFDNVLLSPHNSNSSPEHWERIHIATVENLIEELASSREEQR